MGPSPTWQETITASGAAIGPAADSVVGAESSVVGGANDCSVVGMADSGVVVIDEGGVVGACGASFWLQPASSDNATATKTNRVFTAHTLFLVDWAVCSTMCG